MAKRGRPPKPRLSDIAVTVREPGLAASGTAHYRAAFRWQHKMVAAGLCRACGKERTEASRIFCERHLEAQRACANARHKARRAEGWKQERYVKPPPLSGIVVEVRPSVRGEGIGSGNYKRRKIGRGGSGNA